MQYNKFSKSKLLKSIAANYPILRELGCAISSPIVLVAEEKDFPMLLERLKKRRFLLDDLLSKRFGEKDGEGGRVCDASVCGFRKHNAASADFF